MKKNRINRKNSGGERLISNLRKTYAKNIVFITFLSVFASAFSLAFAYLTKYIVNSALNSESKLTVIFISATVCCLLLRIISRCFYNFYSEKLNAKISLDLRQKAFSALIKGDISGVEKFHSGEIMNRLTSDAAEIAADTTAIAPAAAGLIIQLCGTLALLFTIDYLFAVIFLAGSLLTAATVGLYRSKIKNYRKRTLDNEGRSRSYIQDNLSAVLTVKTYNAEEKTAEKSRFYSNELEKAVISRAKLSSTMNALYSFIGNAGLIFAIIWFGAGLMRGAADYGAATAVILLLLNVSQPINAISGVISAFYTRSVSAERLFELQNGEQNNTKKVELNDFNKICFDNVSFSYSTQNVLNGASFCIKKGDKIAFTGVSGAGKTTVFKLLSGVYKPSGGNVVIYSDENASEKTFAPDKISGLFAFVPQGNFLMSGTVRENLTFFADTAPSDEEIKSALEISCANFVFDMQGGLERELKERGGGLSEGQIQRLAIARALLTNRKIILFDEATSALDEATEKRLMQNLCALKNKTCIFVSHRKTALEQFSEVYEITSNGQIERKEINS